LPPFAKTMELVVVPFYSTLLEGAITSTNSALLVGALKPVLHVRYTSSNMIVHAVYSSPTPRVPFGSTNGVSTKPSFAVSNRSTCEAL
jgi:hypothetical protein